MVYLNTNTANQYAWLSLDEGRAYFNVAFTHYLLVLTYEMTGEQLAQVVTVINENERVTKIRLTTVGLVDAGRYHYEVYGQNSSSNINPINASVVGLVEKGLMILQDGTIYFDVSTPTIPVDVIYTGA
jgi:ABC-type enterochelin transport system ATPase subunit